MSSIDTYFYHVTIKLRPVSPDRKALFTWPELPVVLYDRFGSICKD